MSERALRGSRLGAQSYETDAGVEIAARQNIEFDCPRGHRFTVPFSVEADLPAVWECRVCGSEAVRVDGTLPEPRKTKPARTHWDMLMERRTTADLEELLTERLELLRGTRIRARGGSARSAGSSRKSA
jgi:rubredoxin